MGARTPHLNLMTCPLQVSREPVGQDFDAAHLWSERAGEEDDAHCLATSPAEEGAIELVERGDMTVEGEDPLLASP